MTKGKSKPDPQYQSDFDMSIFAARMIQYLMGERPQITDEGQPELTLIQMCIIMRAMFDNAPKGPLKGKAEQIRKDLEEAYRMVSAESYATKRERTLLEGMRQMGDIDATTFNNWTSAINCVEAKVHREAVELTVRVYRTIYEKVAKPASRPKGSFSKQFSELDDAIIHQAIVDASFERTTDANDVTVLFHKEHARPFIRSLIKEHLDSFKGILHLGETDAGAIDAHHARILRKFDAQFDSVDANLEVVRS